MAKAQDSDIRGFQRQEDQRQAAQERALTGRTAGGAAIANNIRSDEETIGLRTRRLLPERNQAIERRMGRA